MDTVVVTGGAGFIGSNFTRMLLAGPGPRVVVLDKLTYAGNLSNLTEHSRDPRLVFRKTDIADRQAVDSVFSEFQPRAVVNFAAETHVDRSIDSPEPFIRSNIIGVYTLLEATRRYLGSRPSVSRDDFRFLHVSTDEVYGSLGKAGSFVENSPYAPNSPYAASKASGDHLVRAYHETYGVPTLITNCSNNYGPYQFPEKLIPLMILNGLDGRAMPIYGDGGNVRDWLFVEDHCRGVLAVLERGAAGGRYNIGGRCEKTNLQVVEAICRILEEAVPAARNSALAPAGAGSYADLKRFVTDRPGHDRRYAIDPSRIESEIGWRPEHDFDSGLDKTVRWYLENRDWCEEVQSGNYRRQRLGLSGSE